MDKVFVDSHCHITDDGVIVDAYEEGVGFFLNAGEDLDKIEGQLKMCERFPYMVTSAGVHPENAKEKMYITTEDIIAQTKHPKVVAVGECGLDYHYGANSKTEQKEMFCRHIEAAGESRLPLMIHERKAEEDMIKCLYEGKKKYPELKGVIHCFSSNQDFADKVLELGFYISASGIITFKTAEAIREVFKCYPIDKILIETDSPYLAPVPFRGKVNQPKFVIQTAKKLAEIRGLTNDEIGSITRDNFFRLYQKAKLMM